MAHHWIPCDVVQHEPTEDCVCGPTQRARDWVHHPIEQPPLLTRWASFRVVVWNHRRGWNWKDAGLRRLFRRAVIRQPGPPVVAAKRR
jgi:hypothetical protein